MGPDSLVSSYLIPVVTDIKYSRPDTPLKSCKEGKAWNTRSHRIFDGSSGSKQKAFGNFFNAMRKPPFTSQLGLYSNKFLENLRKGDPVWERSIIASSFDFSPLGDATFAEVFFFLGDPAFFFCASHVIPPSPPVLVNSKIPTENLLS